MKFSKWFIELLQNQYNIEHIFGIPGGCLVHFLDNIKESDEIQAHLSMHEYNSGFEAIGYSKTNNSLGVAFGTKGPGFTNLLTAFTMAYQDSIPFLLITSHNSDNIEDKNSFHIRLPLAQTTDTVEITRSISKGSIYLSDIKDAKQKVLSLIDLSLTPRQGPVLLDINTKLWNEEV